MHSNAVLYTQTACWAFTEDPSCKRAMSRADLHDAGDVLLVVLKHGAVCLLRHAHVVESIQAPRQIRQKPAHQETKITASVPLPCLCWASSMLRNVSCLRGMWPGCT